MTKPVEIRIAHRGPFADGHAFGEVGAYERLVGRAHFAVDPRAPAQAGIVDLDKAPRNADGLVELAADLCILKPRDMARGNRRLFFGYGNRGNKRELQSFNDAPASNDPRTLADAGNGFLMRRGYALVWAAWEGDLLPGDGRMVLDVPVASDGDRPITGLVRSEFIAGSPGTTTFALSGKASTRSYPAHSLDPRRASLTRRRYADSERIPIAPEDWSFARVEGGQGLDAQTSESALVPSDTNIHLPNGFEPGWIYELVYTAREPRVHGLGHVVVRDLVSFLKREARDSAGNANPLGENVNRAYCWGRSQTGRIRTSCRPRCCFVPCSMRSTPGQATAQRLPTAAYRFTPTQRWCPTRIGASRFRRSPEQQSPTLPTPCRWWISVPTSSAAS